MMRLITISLFMVLAVSKSTYASGETKYLIKEFFQDIQTINLHVIVTDDEASTRFSYGFDEQEVRSPISRSEIEASVFKSFREMFSEHEITITGDETKEELEKLRKEYEEKHSRKSKLPDADPFDFSDYVPPTPRLIVTVFVVLNRFAEKKGNQLIHGAITTKTVRDSKNNTPDKIRFIGEEFPIIFVLPEEKLQAIDLIKRSVKRAYKSQSRLILCTKVEGGSCIENIKEFLDKTEKSK